MSDNAAPPSAVRPSHEGSAEPHTEHEEHAHHRYPFLAHHYDTPAHQFESGKLGIWIFLVTEVLFFAGLFSAYSVYRSMHGEIFVWAHYYLDTNLGAVNTAVLILSSLTAAWAVRNAQLGQRRLLIANIAVTIACALTFMGIKYVEYSHKFHDGLLWGGRPHADGRLPKYRFDPKEPVWEVERFRHDHPAAAAAAQRLAEKHGARAEGATAASATTVTPAPGPSAAAADGSAATASPASSAVSPVAPVAAVLPASSAAASAATPIAAAPGSSLPVGPIAAASSSPPAAASVAALPQNAAAPAPVASGAAPGTVARGESAAGPASVTPRSVIATLTEEEALPLLRAGILGDQAIDPNAPSRPKNAHVFFGIYFFMTGLHGLHVLAGIGVWLWLLARAIAGQFSPAYFGPIDYAALYWHLVDLIWIYLFPLLYLIH